MITQTARPWQGGPIKLTTPSTKGTLAVVILQDDDAVGRHSDGEP